MPHYKDPAGNLHYLDDAGFAHLLPEGSVEITTQEAKQITESASVQPTYADLRAAEYPPASDYLDGIVKGNQKQVDTYIAACLAVKVKYPKP